MNCPEIIKDTELVLKLTATYTALGAQQLKLLAAAEPNNSEPLEMHGFTTIQEVRCAKSTTLAQYSAQFHKIKVISGISGIIDTKNQQFVDDALFENRERIDRNWYKKSCFRIDDAENVRVFDSPSLQTQHAISLLSWANSNYAHWLSEQLPRFFWISQSCLPSNTVVLVEENLPPSIIETLKLFWDPQRIVYVPLGESVEVETLYYFSNSMQFWEPKPEHLYQGDEHPVYPPALAWMSQVVRARLGGSSAEAPSELYVIRPPSPTGRAVLNQFEVIKTMQDLGFAAIEPGSLALPEQVAVFSQARLVLAPSGAAVANLFWMTPGNCMAVLIQDLANINYWFFHALAQACGVRLVYLPVPSIPDSHSHKIHSNVLIPPENLKTWIKVLRLPSLPAPAKISTQSINQPLVSVCIAAYCHQNYISECLDSVLAQTYQNIEIIVVDDGSKDATAEIIFEYANRFPKKIRCILLPNNVGISMAMNNAIALAQGEFIAFLGSDDRMQTERIQQQVDYLLANPKCGAVFSKVKIINELGEVIETSSIADLFNTPVEKYRNQLLTSNFLNGPSCTVRAACLADVGIYSPLLRYVQDYDLWIRIISWGEIAVLPQSLTEYRIHGKNLSIFENNEPCFQARLETVAVIVRAAKSWPWQTLVTDHTTTDEASVLLALALHLARVDLFFLGQPGLGTAYAYELVLRAANTQPESAAYCKKELEAWIDGGEAPRAVKALPLGAFDATATWTESMRRTSYEIWLKRMPTAYPFDISEMSASIDWTAIIATNPEAVPRTDRHATMENISRQHRTPEKIVMIGENLTWQPYRKISPADKTPESKIPEPYLSQANGWTLLVCPGDRLEIDALLLIERAINKANKKTALLAYFDHDELQAELSRHSPHFKPSFNPDLLLSYPYMGRALAVRTDWAQPLLEQAGGVFDLVLAYRLMLKALRDAGPAGFVHVPAVLAHLTPNEPAVFAQTSEAWQRLAQVLDEHLQITAPGAQIQEGPGPGTFHVIYPLERTPLVSIIIPTRDQLPFLSRCIDSLLSTTDYPAFEILVVDNDSQTPEAREFLAGLAALGTEQIRVLSAPGPFNFSRMNNLAVAQARGEFILLLNNDTAALQADWLSHMVRHALRDGVGIVGARLLYPDGRVQHAGVIMGLRGPAEHPCLGLENTEPGYLFRAQVAQNFSAVTAACLLVSKAVYAEVGGLDEATFGVSYNDIDFCLQVGQTGRRIVWTPLATLLHEGSASQKAGIENKSEAQKVQRFSQEQQAMYLRWPEVIANDPAYNPNLSLAESGYEIETNPLLCFDKFQGLVEHRIAAFAADNEGCGHYRVLQPLQAMLDAGLCTGGASPEIFSPNLALRSGADTLIFQRPNTGVMLANLQALVPLKGIKKIYEVDDHITRVPIKSAHYDHMPRDLRGKMIKAIGLCDRLVVSTEPLARELGSYNDDVRVVHNRIPTAMWGAVPPQRTANATRAAGSKPKVGWAGGIGHLGDLEMIAGVIKDLADTVDWVFFGMCPDNIRPYVKEFYQGIPTLDYPQRLMTLAQDWDLAIAPLESNLFNDCKSNLKLLEYGWCGVPVVCSDVLPYQCDLPATRVKNRHKNWRDAILERVNDLEASRQEGLQLQQRIASDWMLTGDNLQNWYKAWTD